MGVNLEIPPGYGIRILPREDWEATDPTDPRSFEAELMGKLLIWEPPQRGASYILGVDAAAGLGKDRSVVDVLRIPTIAAPAEQVAQFISDDIDPMALAPIVDTIGRFYHDDDDTAALAVIENDGNGILTQTEMQGHLGYTNFYVWQRFDLRNPAQRYSRAIGWVTNRRTRPMMIGYLTSALEQVDPLTGTGDLVINSPFTIKELRDFQAPPGYASWMAEAAPGCHDDCVIAIAIAYTASCIQMYGEEEPLADKRRRLHEQKLRKQFVEEITGVQRSSQNTAVAADGSIYDDWEEQDFDGGGGRWQ